MAALPFLEARRIVLERVSALRAEPEFSSVVLEHSLGRVLAETIVADRDYPPFDRSVRDGFAVRSADLAGPLSVIGEVRAGGIFEGCVSEGLAVEIMTGAPVPEGADCVVMIEHVQRDGDTILVQKPYKAGDHIAPRGVECRSGATILSPGTRIGPAHIAAMASVGHFVVDVYRQPCVAIIATGDELVPDVQAPLPHQIRNSNSYSLAAQVRNAGGEPCVLDIAPDSLEETAALIAEGLEECDIILISGGVSAGKYDFVEPALARHGAEFFFDRVLIQPGQPLVFGQVQGKFFFGLPGNPASTMVCFELFARAAIELLSGQTSAPLPLGAAKLTRDFSHRPGLTRFLPALLSPDGLEITPVPWSGSGDVTALAAANCFLVADPDRPEYKQGDSIGLLLR